MKQVSFFVIVIILLIGCYDKRRDFRQNDRNEILNNLFVPVFDSLEQAYQFNGQFLIHVDLYPDIIKSESITRLEDFFKTDSAELLDEKLMLLARLTEVVNDSVSIGLKEIETKNVTLLFYENDSLLNSPDYFGTFSMTNPAFDDSGSKCVFYLAINCGNKCSRGFIFFATRENDVWEVDDFYQVWR
jgi:hypothetical protein